MPKGKRYKAYLPKWMAWFVLVIMIPVATMGLYETIYVEKNALGELQ